MAPKRKRVEFKILAPQAGQVLLAGTFNKWSERSDPMKRDKEGNWKKIKILPKGKYEYKFIVDGEWIPDPGCSKSAPNQFGTLNSVFKV